MEINRDILLMIIGSSIVTLIPRIVPLMLLSRIQIPEWGMRWLNFVPIAVMSALIGQELFITDGRLSIDTKMLAALPTFLVAVWTKSLLGTVVIGVLSMMVFRYLF